MTTARMNTYTVTNTATGQDLGTFEIFAFMTPEDLIAWAERVVEDNPNRCVEGVFHDRGEVIRVDRFGTTWERLDAVTLEA